VVQEEIMDEHQDRVRASTDPEVLARLDRDTRQRVRELSGDGEAIERRIDELRRESDVERALEINASSIILGAVTLGLLGRRRYLLLAATVAGFLLQHGVRGWCPPLALLRRLGIRTRGEIDAELTALRALRGDFAGVAATGEAPVVGGL
jgi:hypothetical protein